MECEIPEKVNELSILLTDDACIRELNFNYRKKNKATDVLSFSQLENPSKNYTPGPLGDLVISLDTARRQAKKYRHSFEKELLRLIVHGILHLAGYEHEKVPQSIARKMRKKEKEIIRDLKFMSNISKII